MNRKKVAKYTAFFVAMFALLATPVNAPPFLKARPAQITAEGAMTLNDISEEPVNLTINANFTSIVPNTVSSGEHDNVEFHGFAIVPDERAIIKFEGLLVVGGPNFWVKFGVEKPTDPEIPEGRYSANGKLNITISEITLPPPEITWVLMKGKVTKYDEKDAFGGLMAHAKISENNNWTKVNCAFTLQPPPKESEMPKNFSCSFFVVTLANATKTELDYDGSDLYIEGLWNVYNRTITVTVFDTTEMNVSVTIRQIVEEANGNLSVSLTSEPSPIPWRIQGNFTLKIQGIDMIIGDVIFYHVKMARPFERGIPVSDFNEDRIVDIQDIAQTAKVYGTKSGSAKYKFDLDLNSDFEINIIDLATVAKEFGQEY